MTGRWTGLAVLAAFLVAGPAFGQQLGQASGRATAQQTKPQRTVEQRLTALEHQVASLETRLGVRTAPGAPSSTEFSVQSRATAQRIAQLQQRLSSLTADVKRIERQTDAAMRAATQAQRDAMYAQQLARDNARRIR